MSGLTTMGWTTPERFVATRARWNDGYLRGQTICTADALLDAERKYPVVEDIYAGPHGSFVPKGRFHLARFPSKAWRSWVLFWCRLTGWGRTIARGRFMMCVGGIWGMRVFRIGYCG